MEAIKNDRIAKSMNPDAKYYAFSDSSRSAAAPGKPISFRLTVFKVDRGVTYRQSLGRTFAT
jgi:hypothetical protein